MAESKKQPSPLHVVVFSWLAFGHIVPFLELSEQLAGWVPQVRVLAHAAVGAFVTHCGWGSTVESLFRFGIPLVMLPFVADQGLIARAMAARGAGVEVPRDDGDGSFRREDVAAAVRRVMAEEEGVELARRARELQRVVGDRVKQEEYVDELVEYLQHYK